MKKLIRMLKERVSQLLWSQKYESDLEAMACRINSCFEKYNESGSHPYKLGFSMGYAVYDHHSHMSAEEFLKQVDILMYEEKQAYKNKLSM